MQLYVNRKACYICYIVYAEAFMVLHFMLHGVTDVTLTVTALAILTPRRRGLKRKPFRDSFDSLAPARSVARRPMAPPYSFRRFPNGSSPRLLQTDVMSKNIRLRPAAAFAIASARRGAELWRGKPEHYKNAQPAFVRRAGLRRGKRDYTRKWGRREGNLQPSFSREQTFTDPAWEAESVTVA
jgi:hypothetical protein